MNMAQKHYYLVAHEKPIAHDAPMKDLYLWLDLVASSLSEYLLSPHTWPRVA